MKSLTLILLILSLPAFAQKSEIFRIDSIPTEGVLLDKNWKWNEGDNPDFAKADFDDSAWESIDPTKDIFDLPQISKNGQIGWLRLTLLMDESLLKEQISLVIQQTGASEIYLNGSKIVTNGIINTSEIKAKDPLWKPFPINLNNQKQQVLAVRFALQPNILYTAIFENYNPAIWINIMDSAVGVEFHYSVTSRNLIFIFLIIGISFMIFVIHFSFYILYPNQKANLYFSLFSFFFLLGSLSQYFYWLQPFQVSYKFYLGNLAFLLFIIAYVNLLTAAYLFLEKKKDFFYYFLAVFSVVAVFLNAYPYSIGWKLGGPMQELFVQINIARIAVIAVRKKQKGSWIIAVGAFSTLIFFVIFLSQGTFTNASFLLSLPLKRMIFYNFFVLSLPISTSLFLAFQFSKINEDIQLQLIENQNLADEKQQILSTQNETLETQVIERTAELKHKNRDLEIEAALERVRSRSMAMHRSHELSDVIKVIFEQFQLLGFNIKQAGFTTNIHEQDWDLWLALPNYVFPNKVILPYFDHPIFNRGKEILEKKQDFLADILTFEETNQWFYHMFKTPYFNDIPEKSKSYLLSIKGMARSAVNTKNIALTIFNYDALPYSPEENLILRRFANAFEQSYTRFLDLQKAEAQAREAQIEAALEKIRSRTLTMQQSSELKEIIAMVHEKLKELNVVLGTIAFWFFDKNTMSSTFWVANDLQHEDLVLLPYDEKILKEDTCLKDSWEARFSDENIINKKYSNEQTNKYFDYVFAHNSLAVVPANVREFVRQAESHIMCLFIEKNSTLYADSWNGQLYSDEMISVLERTAKVFEQAYVRFLDLKKAESQAKAAKIEVVLERIRSRAMNMRSSEELNDLVGFVFAECTNLDMSLDRSIFMIYDKIKNDSRWWLAGIEAPDKPVNCLVKYHEYAPSLAYLQAWQNREQKWVYLLEGDNKKTWDKYVFEETEMAQLPEFVKHGMSSVESIILNASFQNYGGLTLGTYEPLSGEHFDLLVRLSKAFDLAYTRFLDLQLKEAQAVRLAEEKQKLEVTLSELKQTQNQLIQKEKLASLGELTAGIAHEIQNPLNFVNNFSELSVDLAKDLNKEIHNPDSDKEYIEELLTDLTANQEKINHHGKRASSIVKGMLEHSRASTGVKELTDINALADEYFRLSYHGMRAKDKEFNATMETHFQDPLSKIELIPQDIGRVLLNLINNAFYAVSEKSKQNILDAANGGTEGVSYNPTVTIYTQLIDNQIIIKIKDNGMGMPESVRVKVFQPFFTTKPTGQGTGLGLSLAYDIVTKGHGGTLEVESTEGIGSEFIIKI